MIESDSSFDLSLPFRKLALNTILCFSKLQEISQNGEGTNVFISRSLSTTNFRVGPWTRPIETFRNLLDDRLKMRERILERLMPHTKSTVCLVRPAKASEFEECPRFRKELLISSASRVENLARRNLLCGPQQYIKTLNPIVSPSKS